MTYEKILLELKVQNLDQEFCSTFEKLMTPSFLQRVNSTSKIHSTPSLIRTVLALLRNSLDYDLEVYNRWVLILQWFMTPVFARKPNVEDWIKE